MTKYDILLNWITENAQNIMLYAIHCDTNEKAEDLISMLYLMGFHWENDKLTAKHFAENGSVTTKWSTKGKQTCYSITSNKLILHSSISFCNNQGKIVVEYDDLFDEADDIDKSIDAQQLKKNFVDEVQEDVSESETILQRSVINQKECPECHNILFNDGSKYCMNCGYEIPSDFFLDEVVTPVDIDISSDSETVDDTDEHEELQREDDVVPSESEVSSSLSESQMKVRKTNKKLIKQITIICLTIIIVIGVILGVNCFNAKSNNDYGKFSSEWQTVTEQTSIMNTTISAQETVVNS